MLRNLQAEIGRKNIKQREMAESIGVSEKTLWNKVNGLTSFTFPETEAIRDTFFPELKLEYLFANTDIDREVG